MKKSGLPPIAWALAGLLAVAAFMISLGQQDTEANPEVSSYAPSGLAAFADLLESNGIKVAVNLDPKPKLGPNDVAVVFKRLHGKQVRLLGQGSEEETFHDDFLDAIKAGGTGIVLPIETDFQTASKATVDRAPAMVADKVTGETYRVTTTITDSTTFTDLDGNDDGIGMTLWTAKDPFGRFGANYPAPNIDAGTSQSSDAEGAVPPTISPAGDAGGPFLRAYKVGKGTVLVARDAIGITNRFIDKEDNAKAFASALQIIAKGGKRVVFEEASFGNVQEKGLLETVGPWANAAWQQLVFLGVVVIFTLGRRFGIAEEPRVRQRGARELLDGISDTFKRAKSTNIALATAWTRADADIRVLLKLPRDATRSERDRLLPVGLQNALARLEAATKMPYVPQDDALDLVKRAQAEMDAFLGPHRAKMRSQAKLKA